MYTKKDVAVSVVNLTDAGVTMEMGLGLVSEGLE